jgi:hypothetical protein
MSVDIVQVFAREDASKPWWHDSFPAGHLEYFQENFINPGIYTGTREVSADGLLLIVTHTFVDEAAKQKFITDPYLVSCVPLRDAHNTANGITKVM